MSAIRVLGYRSYWGRYLLHIMRVTDDGPGAVGIHAICGTRAGGGCCIVGTLKNPPPRSEWPTLKQELATYRDPREAKATCPKCVQRAQKIGLSEVEA